VAGVGGAHWWRVQGDAVGRRHWREASARRQGWARGADAVGRRGGSSARAAWPPSSLLRIAIAVVQQGERRGAEAVGCVRRGLLLPSCERRRWRRSGAGRPLSLSYDQARRRLRRLREKMGTAGGGSNRGIRRGIYTLRSLVPVHATNQD
jgi:hypothetical protein